MINIVKYTKPKKNNTNSISSVGGGVISNNGEIDFVKCENILLKEFKDGLLGRMTLEWL